MSTVPGTGTRDQHNSRVCERQHVADRYAILTVPDEARGGDTVSTAEPTLPNSAS